MLGGLLSIKPLIELTNGEVKAIATVRTRGQANERMTRFLLNGSPLERLAILHTGAEARAREFLNELMQEASQSLGQKNLSFVIWIALTFVNPLVAILLGNLFAGEPLSLRVLLAAGVILSGVVLITANQQSRRSLQTASPCTGDD